MSKPPPPEPIVPWHVRVIWHAWGWITWLPQVRQLKRDGWQRTGWMQWESPGGADGG